MRFLAQGVDPDATPCMLQCAADLSTTLQMRRQLMKRPEKQLGKALLLGQNPVLITVREERSAVPLDGVGKEMYPFGAAFCPLRGLKISLKQSDIRCDGVGIQSHRGAVCDNDGAARHTRRFKLMAQRRECGAQPVTHRV